jgi:hypothetical protein
MIAVKGGVDVGEADFDGEIEKWVARIYGRIGVEAIDDGGDDGGVEGRFTCSGRIKVEHSIKIGLGFRKQSFDGGISAHGPPEHLCLWVVLVHLCPLSLALAGL